ncbi:acyl carrier protein [Lapidilactobacillus luobeiensis]|uniref:acyl carrier protein n=1 Tax=Lapidilactobacillus luobeiensis TaxID=2950371 RepID=UPI0021C3422F|nr:acyl carrier protein [Lapidilactobacillus luobeiensis]
MTEKEVYDKVIDLIAERFEVEPAKLMATTNIKNDLAADSIDLVEFVLELEDTFGGEIPDDEAEKLNTIDDVVKYIVAHQN